MVRRLKKELEEARERLQELQVIRTSNPRQRRTNRGLQIETGEAITKLEIVLGIRPARRNRTRRK